MPIALTTPHVYDPGHGAAPESLPHVFIIDFQSRPIAREMSLVAQYGTYDPATGGWVPGSAPTRTILIANRDAYIDKQGLPVSANPEFDAMVATAIALPTDTLPGTSIGYSLYVGVGRHLYQFLLDQGYYEGTVI